MKTARMHRGLALEELERRILLAAPDLALIDDLLLYSDYGQPMRLDDSATVSDPDEDWDAGVLSAQIMENAEASDRLSLVETTEVSLSFNDVLVSGTIVASMENPSVSGDDVFLVTFNQHATSADVQAVVRALAYESSSGGDNIAYRTVQVALTDAAGESDIDARQIELGEIGSTPPEGEEITPPPPDGDQLFRINENSPNGTYVGAVSVAGEGEITYNVISGSGAFAVGSGTGNITVADSNQLDYETTAVFAFDIEATNGAGQSSIVHVTVELNDIAEGDDESGGEGENQPPLINDQFFAIDENSPDGTFVGTISASDDDPITYSIVAGSGSGAFAVDSGTGNITVADSSQLDFETMPVFTFEIQVMDTAEQTATALVTIDLNDLVDDGTLPDENPPAGDGESPDPDNPDPDIVYDQVILNAAQRSYTFLDADGDQVRISYVGPGQAVVAIAQDGDINSITLAGATEKSSLSLRDMNPTTGPNTIVGGAIAGSDGESLGTLFLMNPMGTVLNTTVSLDADLRLFRVMGDADNVDITVGGNLGRALVCGDFANGSSVAVGGNMGYSLFRGIFSDSTLDVTGDLRNVSFQGGLAASAVEVDGFTSILMSRNGQTSTTIYLGSGVRQLMLRGGMRSSGVNVAGDVQVGRFYDGFDNLSSLEITGNAQQLLFRGGIDGASSVHVQGSTRLFSCLAGGITGGSVVALDGDVTSARIMGVPDGPSVAFGSRFDLGADLKGQLMLRGDLDGRAMVAGSSQAASIRLTGDLNGYLLSGIFGNVTVSGCFTGRITADAEGVGNTLRVGTPGGGGVISLANSFEHAIGVS
ncbi:MAG: cadherin repeat domain-containing protein [Planctomycetota bacterium]